METSTRAQMWPYLVGHLHVHAGGIGIGVHGDGLDTQSLGGTDDTAGNFSSVGDQDLVKGLALVATVAQVSDALKAQVRSGKDVLQHLCSLSRDRTEQQLTGWEFATTEPSGNCKVQMLPQWSFWMVVFCGSLRSSGHPHGDI